MKWFHSNTAHSGRGMTLNKIRCNGSWVICGSSVVKLIFKCVIWYKLRGRIGEPMMTDLPKDRFEESPYCAYCAVDTFGPSIVKVK